MFLVRAGMEIFFYKNRKIIIKNKIFTPKIRLFMG